VPLDRLETEGRNPASSNLDELTPLEIVQLMSMEDRRLISAVSSQSELIALAITIIAERLAAGGRLIYIGAGTSGRLGVLDATECPPTFNSPPTQVVGLIAGGFAALTQAVEGAEDRPELAEQDLTALRLNERDVLVGIATSGRTPYVLGGIVYARRHGAYTIGISCNPGSELGTLVELAITPVAGPEVLSGSTRLKAGTATKMVLNMLSTGAMVRLGKTYGNLMVDLRATNSKLRARSNRIVRLLTGLDSTEADSLLKNCDGELKTALVSFLARVPPPEARQRLTLAQGRVRDALQGLQTPSPPSSLSPRPRAVGLCLGIDGGGSHTVALLASKDAILGRGEAGPSNPQALGFDQASLAWEEAVARAFASAGLLRGPVEAACLGLAGVDRPEDLELVRAWARRCSLTACLEVTNDAALLLAAGTPDGWGLAVVAGTGSMVFGRTSDGRTARSGGWGYLLGDEGSAYALALAALRAVARAADARGPGTVLSQKLLERLGLKLPQQLIAAVYRDSLDRPGIAVLAPLVLDAADAEDQVAQDIVEEQVGLLALTVTSAAKRLDFKDSKPALALSGSLLVKREGYRARLLEQVKALGLIIGPVGLVQEPAEGALRLARAANPSRPVA
jgi:N-acetylmuramic acid 6-phosphate etherase